MGKLYHKGESVNKIHDTTREWFETSIKNIDDGLDEWLNANLLMREMMMRSEVGSKDAAESISLVQSFASQGYTVTKEYIESIDNIFEVLG